MAWYEYNSVDGILFDEASEGEMFLKINWGPLHETTWTIYEDVVDTEEAIHDFYETCEAYFTVFWTGLVDYDVALEPWRIEAAEFNDAGQLLVLVRQEPAQGAEWSSVLELPSLNAFYAFFDNIVIAILQGWAANPVHPNWHHPLLPALDAEDEEMVDDVLIVAVVQNQMPAHGAANQEGDEDDDAQFIAFVQHNP